ncbi:unnamed protein product [Lampetra planeri]
MRVAMTTTADRSLRWLVLLETQSHHLPDKGVGKVTAALREGTSGRASGRRGRRRSEALGRGHAAGGLGQEPARTWQGSFWTDSAGDDSSWVNTRVHAGLPRRVFRIGDRGQTAPGEASCPGRGQADGTRRMNERKEREEGTARDGAASAETERRDELARGRDRERERETDPLRRRTAGGRGAFDAALRRDGNR